MKRTRVVGVIVAALSLAACEPVAPDVDGGIVTGRDSYVLQRTDSGIEGTIDHTFTNRTDETAYVVNCLGGHSLSLERWQGGEWVLAWSPVVLGCLSEPIVIEPGGAHSDTVNVFAGHRGSNLYPQFKVREIEGTYRLVWHDIVHDYDDGHGTPLPLRDRVSNTFRIEVE